MFGDCRLLMRCSSEDEGTGEIGFSQIETPYYHKISEGEFDFESLSSKNLLSCSVCLLYGVFLLECWPKDMVGYDQVAASA